ncbi:major facilitator superfamily domain-containing protein [Scleroderma citrinum]
MGSLDPVYQAKVKLLNDAFQEIGMGKYQWHLYMVAGLGWWSPSGLLAGAIFWGIGYDLWGRKWPFNLTILVTAVFAFTAAASPNYITPCVCVAGWSFGVGGNLPVGSIVFREFVPASHQYMLTVLSVFWTLGDLTASLAAWPLISNFSCPPAPAPCPTSSNRGWRYHLLIAGGIMAAMWIFRFFVFNFQESPKYLMGYRRDEDAVAIVHRVADINGKNSNLTLTHLKEAEMLAGESTQNGIQRVTPATAVGKFSKFSAIHVSPPFATWKLAYSTSILTTLWALFGLAFPLYYTFQTYYPLTGGAENDSNAVFITYRDLVVAAFLGVPAALMAGYLVEIAIFGRRGTLAIFTVLTGVFILLSTTICTSNAYAGWILGYSYVANIMYGVLYAITLELFPTKCRGTGSSMVFAVSRVFCTTAPIIALYANMATSVPRRVSGAITIATGLVPLLLPIEPRGKAAL